MAKERAIIKREKDRENNLKLKTNHLLVIGIDEYKDKGIATLNNAVRDAQRFVEILQTDYQFEPTNTIELYNIDATKDSILAVFDLLIKSLGKEDNLILYFSGHGDLIESIDRGYWIPTEARLEKRGDYLSNGEVLDFFRALQTHHIFAIVDACFSGALAKNIEKPSYSQRVDLKPSRWLLSSGALEKVSDGAGKHSPFANSLFSALIDTDKSELNVMALCNDVLATIDSNTRDQTPIGQPIFGVGHMMGQFIFYKKGYAPKAELSDEVASNKTVLTRSSSEATTIKMPVDQTVDATEERSPSITTFSDLQIHLKSLIQEDLKLALHSYEKVVSNDSDAKNDITIQLGRFNRANKDSINGLSTSEQRNRTFARIRYALTQMIDGLEEKDVVEDYATILNV